MRLCQRGFTLMELVIGLAILTLISGLFAVSLNSFLYNQSRIREIEQARTAVNVLLEDLASAAAITEPARGATGPVLSYTLDPTGSSPVSYTVAIGTARTPTVSCARRPA